MASRALFIAVVIVAAAMGRSLATDYTVGDDVGWKLEVNYTNWAKGKQFYVGDRLIFTYNKDIHNVAKANGTQFQQCLTPDDVNIMNSGNDTITLGNAGKKWYFCSISNHCFQGMKLVINVMQRNGSANAPAPQPWAPVPTPAPDVTDPSAATTFSPLKSCGWFLAALAGFIMVVA